MIARRFSLGSHGRLKALGHVVHLHGIMGDRLGVKNEHLTDKVFCFFFSKKKALLF